MRFLLYLACLSSAFAQSSVVDLTILHYNDFHARLLPSAQGVGGAAYLASAIKQERTHCPRCVLLSAGDSVQGTPVSTIFRGLPVFEVLRPLGVDAFALGNHEFDYGYERINDFMAASGPPVLAANFLTPEGRLFTDQASVILERDGLRIGIVGALMQDLVPSLEPPSKLGANRMTPTLEALRAEAARLQGKTDILIALVHLWKEGCDQIVRELPEYAITVSGHDHGGLQQMYRADDRVGVRVRSYGSELGRLDLRYDKATRKVVSAEWKRIPITTAAYQPDPEVAKLVQKWEDKVKAVVDTPIGNSAAKKNKEETRLWIQQVMRDKTGAQFALMNSGGVRDLFPAGRIHARDVWNIMPFDNMLVTARVPGRLLPDSIRGDQQIDPAKLYSFTTIDFLVEGWRVGADSKMKELGSLMPLEGPFLRDAMIEWVQSKQTVE
ncbi:bifunctional metallophosphatase/5'-nucleotidase [Bryobacter aggregatus]|uniref:bifunctional metallophosphatase/5'-nucleotidase n=1 Tax=Bryobacter aggregatus TaxID=360054 RepID=UPI0004E101B3|nr:bifunctional UDP-sugar hydrolase/5'-nucleotidase [Bryobacter aggregatus]